MQFNLLNFLILNYWKYMNILIVYYSINIMFLSKLVSQNHHLNMFVKVSLKKKYFCNYGSKHKSFLANQLLPKPTFKKPYWKKNISPQLFPNTPINYDHYTIRINYFSFASLYFERWNNIWPILFTSWEPYVGYCMADSFRTG